MAYVRFLDGERASIGSVTTLVLQETWLAYSMISNTVPCLRSFVGAFTTNGLVVTRYGTTISVTKGSSIALNSLRRANNDDPDDIPIGLTHTKKSLRPDMALYRVGITRGIDRRAEEAGDVDSMASDGSERMIIRRATEVQVQFDTRSG